MNTNAKMVLTALVADTPIHLVGPPGVGKTATVEQVARWLNRPLVTVIGATRDRTDFGGWPRYDEVEDRVKLYPFPWVQELLEAGEQGILFIDEINSNESIFPVLLRVLAERYVGDVKVRSSIVAASNPEELSVAGLTLPPPVANRLLHYRWKTDPEEWAQGMRMGFESLCPDEITLPSGAVVEAHVREVRALVAAFIERYPTALLEVPKEGADGPWPSPRSWELLARFLGAARALGMDGEVEALGAQGAVGGRGYEFLHFVRTLDLPHPAELLKDPSLLPQRDDAAYAALMSAAAHALEQALKHGRKEAWHQAWRLLAHVAQRRHADLAARPAYYLAKAYDGGSEAERRALSPLPKEITAFAPLLSRMRLLGVGG